MARNRCIAAALLAGLLVGWNGLSAAERGETNAGVSRGLQKPGAMNRRRAAKTLTAKPGAIQPVKLEDEVPPPPIEPDTVETPAPEEAPEPAEASHKHGGAQEANGPSHAGAMGVVTDAPLYPVPRPGIPLAVGGTMITNPALDPHEMLYAHRYRSLYPPFYHKTTRTWVMTPFGVHKSERRQLMGTEVEVKYHSYYKPFSFFRP